MPQTINTNLSSLNAQRNLNASQNSLSVSMQRLSSGLRVNSAKDDAAGLAIAERMNSQVKGMNVAIRNANDGISLAQTAEGALGKMTDSLQRMRELAIQSANGTNSTTDRAALANEFTALQEEITRVITNSKFNDRPLFDATAAAGIVFQVGAGTTADNQITVKSANLASGAIFDSAQATTLIDTAANSLLAIGSIDKAIEQASTVRSTFGAAQSRFDAVISNLQVAAENQSAAKSRIMDADYAAETANMSRAQILQQAGNAMIAQANQLPQQVLKLLQG
jgi:flagellin